MQAKRYLNGTGSLNGQIDAAAPGLKLMVSEEPKPEIFEHADYIGDGQIDIWLPVLHNYDPVVSHMRESEHGEETWVYFLSSTRPPYLNPITLDHPGIEGRLTGWLLWKYRLRGLAYYTFNDWSTNPWSQPMSGTQNGEMFLFYPPSESNQAIGFGENNHGFVPSIRLELIRDSLEDYEYLSVLNLDRLPVVGSANPADFLADRLVDGLTSYNRDSGLMYNLRRVIGLKNGGELDEIPDITPSSCLGHPRAQGVPGNDYLNFQDPAGGPWDSPLMVDGRQYMKIGWDPYDSLVGYGWYGDADHVMSQCLTTGPNALQKSILYDDWGRLHTFEFNLPRGTYDVTLSVGWRGGTYSHQRVVIEGIPFVDDEATTPDIPYLVRTRRVTVDDCAPRLEMGIFDEDTMLNYMTVEAVSSAIADRDGDVDGGDLAGYTADLADGIDVLPVHMVTGISGLSR